MNFVKTQNPLFSMQELSLFLTTSVYADTTTEFCIVLKFSKISTDTSSSEFRYNSSLIPNSRRRRSINRLETCILVLYKRYSSSYLLCICPLRRKTRIPSASIKSQIRKYAENKSPSVGTRASSSYYTPCIYSQFNTICKCRKFEKWINNDKNIFHHSCGVRQGCGECSK